MGMADLKETDNEYYSIHGDTVVGISLANSTASLQVDLTKSHHVLIEIEEFRNVVGLSSPLQAGFLINQDQSCWLTNLGRNGSVEVYRPMKKIYRKLAHQQVAYLRDGDYIGLYGAFYKLSIEENYFSLIPVEVSNRSRF